MKFRHAIHKILTCPNNKLERFITVSEHQTVGKPQWSVFDETIFRMQPLDTFPELDMFQHLYQHFDLSSKNAYKLNQSKYLQFGREIKFTKAKISVQKKK